MIASSSLVLNSSLLIVNIWLINFLLLFKWDIVIVIGIWRVAKHVIGDTTVSISVVANILRLMNEFVQYSTLHKS